MLLGAIEENMKKNQRDETNTPPIIPFETIARLRGLALKLHEKGEVKDTQLLASMVHDLVQATGRPGFYVETFFGSCPSCGDSEELLNLDRKRYAVCHEHRNYWYLGRDFLGNNADESADDNRNLLTYYSEIPTKASFPTEGCPCCGFYIEHASWCVIPGAERP
jgi:hypothetical protein